MSNPATPARRLADKANLYNRIRRRFDAVRGIDLELPPRELAREPLDFSGFDATLSEVRETFADMSLDVLEGLIGEAVACLRDDKHSRED